MKLYTYETYARRTLCAEVADTVSSYCRNVGNAVDLLRSLRLADYPEEHFVALCLNTKCQFVGCFTVSIGSVSSSYCGPREVFRSALLCGASSVILAHNHPSGDPTPSPTDVDSTRRLREAGELLGIQVLDHIILGAETHVSLCERGWV